MFANQFVFNLYQMLQTADEESVISWQPDNRSFAIRDSKKFTEEVLPRYGERGRLKREKNVKVALNLVILQLLWSQQAG
jgi:HSF-type DNA-binding